MMTKYDQKTTVEGEVFEQMREDTNKVIQKLIKNMVEKKTYSGSIAINIDVELIPEFIPIPPEMQTEESGETRMVLKPTIEHKVRSTMQIKHDEKGRYDSDMFCLVWDEDQQAYVLTPIKHAQQMSIFDVIDTEPEEVTETPLLEGPVEEEPEETEQYMLPGPTEDDDIIDDEKKGYPFDGYDYDEPDDQTA